MATIGPDMMAFIEGIGGPELLMVLFVVLLLFGGEKLPSLARSLGKSMNELKKASSEVEREIKRAMEEVPEKPKEEPALKAPGAVPQVTASTAAALPEQESVAPAPEVRAPGDTEGKT